MDRPLRKVYIYGLFDETGIRYVGQTVYPRKRLCSHLHDKSNTHKGRWIRKVLSEGKRPSLTILEEANERTYQDRERAWISFGRRTGWRLTNDTNGGDGTFGNACSEVRKRKIGEANKGRKMPPLSEEHRRKIGIATSEARRGKPLSEAQLKVIVERNKRTYSEETRKRMSEAHKGKTMSEETRRKMSEAQKRRHGREAA